MDRTIDNDIKEFVATLDDFFDRRGDAADRDRWAALCGIGLPALRVSEPRGIGASLKAATAIAEKLGAVLVPEPASTAIVIAHALDRCGGPAELRDSIIGGSQIVSFSDFAHVTLTTADTVAGHVEVADDKFCDLVALLADSALVIVDRDALPVSTDGCNVDPSRPTAGCDLDCTPAMVALRMPPETMTAIADELTIMMISELAGGLHAVLTETIGYVRDREQFGRSIGTFQAVKHSLADFYATTEQARAAVQFAATSCDEGRESASSDISAAARWVVRSAVDMFGRAIHLHGAMGYSWEVNIHLHLRRALAVHRMLSDERQFVA
jgi:alkylation response protein AidB-like acyl-CoA dehydrogenase